MSNIPEKEIIFKTIINGKKGNNLSTNLVKPNFSYWTIGYLIKKSFCEKILSDSSNIIKNTKFGEFKNIYIKKININSFLFYTKINII